jgi:hypothetical protein
VRIVGNVWLRAEAAKTFQLYSRGVRGSLSLGVCREPFVGKSLLVSQSPLMAALVILGAVVTLRFQVWRAVLFLKPESCVVDVETPAEATSIPVELDDAWAELKALGFVVLGVRREKRLFGNEALFFDSHHPKHPVAAALSLTRDGEEQLELLTRSERGLVITANCRRIAREVPGVYLSGGLEGVSCERLLKAHLRRVGEIGMPIPITSLEQRVDVARAWYAGAGKPELRQEHAVGLLWTVGALGMLGASVFRFIH